MRWFMEMGMRSRRSLSRMGISRPKMRVGHTTMNKNQKLKIKRHKKSMKKAKFTKGLQIDKILIKEVISKILRTSILGSMAS